MDEAHAERDQKDPDRHTSEVLVEDKQGYSKSFGSPFAVRSGKTVCRCRLQSSYASATVLVSLLTMLALQWSARITFNKDIAPIVWHRCSPCHRPGEIGPFNLLSYSDVRQRLTQIGIVTSRRLMPPWAPEAGRGEFDSERRLTDRELQAIQEWIAAGAIEGDKRDLPPLPTALLSPGGWQLGTPDLVVTMPRPYTVRAAGGDLFRTFVLPIPSVRARYVRAIEFRPENARVVHHANIGVDRTRSSRQLDEKDPEPGYAGGMVPDARYPEGQLLGWTPGQAAHAVPSGMTWRLEPNSDLVLQLHLQPTGRPEPLQVSVGFYFSDDPPTRMPLGLRLGSETIDIPAGDHEYIVRDEYVLPVDVEILAVQPHAHNLARQMEARATLPDGGTRWLISIPSWDFRWQDVYRYKTPFVLPKGSTISMRCTYDNSADNVRNPHRPPARVVWGQNTTDEMGDLWIQVVPVAPGDFAALRADFRRKAHAEDLAAYRKLLREDPTNPLRHDAVGDLYLEADRYEDAIAAYRESLKLNNASATTHYNLAYALSVRGRRAEAVDEFENAIRIDPEYSQAHNNLGAVLQLLGRTDEARHHYERAIALRPDNVDARVNLAQLLSLQGDAADAAAQFREALAIRADIPQALAGLAWIYATASDPALHDPGKAVALAERAADVSGRRDVSALDALAAAYASAGRFDDAVTTVQAGINLATAAGLTQAVAQLRERLALYQRRQTYRQSKFL
jgi:tetratricopeptide (TPR) repeat protein